MRTVFRAFLALAVVALIVTAVNSPMTAQNIGFGGRYPSDAGPAYFKYGTATDTTQTTILTTAQQGTNVYGYLYWAQCVSTSASVSVALVKQGTTTIAAVACVPSSGYSAPVRFSPPIKMPTANTAVTIENSAGVTTAYFVTAMRTAR